MTLSKPSITRKGKCDELRRNITQPSNRKKDYVCEWCGQKIPKGEKHLSRVFKFEGDFNTGRMHLECEQDMKQAPFHDLEDGWVFGSNDRPIANLKPTPESLTKPNQRSE
jgi:hypothetical protein